jgi:hypothetical protein
VQSLRDILLLEDTTTFAIEIGTWVSKREQRVGFGQLSKTEQTVLCLDGVEREVNNGGFDQFYFNSAGDHAQETPAALRRIGAPQMAAIVDQANAAFGTAGPSPERYVRQAQMEAQRERELGFASRVDSVRMRRLSPSPGSEAARPRSRRS